MTWHWRPAAEEAIAPGGASLVQPAPAVPPCSTVPSPSRASIAPAPAASASGTLAQLRSAWQQYGVTVQNLPAGAMSAHNDLAFVIDRAGVIRQEIDADPGPGTTSTRSSFAVLFAADVRQALSQS